MKPSECKCCGVIEVLFLIDDIAVCGDCFSAISKESKSIKNKLVKSVSLSRHRGQIDIPASITKASYDVRR